MIRKKNSDSLDLCQAYMGLDNIAGCSMTEAP